MSMVRPWPCRATSTNKTLPSTAAITSARQVTSCAPRSPIQRPKKPAMNAPSKGRKMAAMVISALQRIDVFDRDGAAVAEIDHQDGEADGGLGCPHRQHEHGEDLPHQIVHKGGKGAEVNFNGGRNRSDRN